MTVEDVMMIEVGHVVRFGQTLFRYPVGTRAICIECIQDDDTTPAAESTAFADIVELVIEDGAVHALSRETLASLGVHTVGYVPALHMDAPHARERVEKIRCALRRDVARPPAVALFDRLLACRRAELAQPVRRGAGYLDAHRLVWWNQIDLATLDLSSDDHCLIGQLYPGDVGVQLERMTASILAWIWPAELEEETVLETYGFFLPHDARSVEAEVLTDLWREEIQTRRSACIARS